MSKPVLIVGQLYAISGERGRRFELLSLVQPKRSRKRVHANFRDAKDGTRWTFLVEGKPYRSRSGLIIRPRRVCRIGAKRKAVKP